MAIDCSGTESYVSGGEKDNEPVGLGWEGHTPSRIRRNRGVMTQSWGLH